MSKIVILGSTGMLGFSVYQYFNNNTQHDILGSYRNESIPPQTDNGFYFDALKSSIEDIPDCEYLINCIGIIKPFMETDKAASIYTNSVFPHKLSQHCLNKGVKLIHITTDCVFSGNDGKYSEESFHDCEDQYGKSKSLGEPKNCMVLRTSIIGEEIHKSASLVEWVKKNKGGKINGFTNHFWNGVTTKHYAEVCEQIIDGSLYEMGVFHVYSNSVSKYELLEMINKKYGLNIDVKPVETKKVDRTLTSKKNLIKKIVVKSLEQQVKEL
jgi:dTDP-4-dehydrorhamnose reductase